MINATKPYLPPKESFNKYVDDIWKTGWLTNNGKHLRELEIQLNDYLGTRHLAVVNNGTIAIQIIIKAMQLHGDVITTPFSYVATTSSLVWENCNPVFADIDPETLCISPAEIEKRITPNTTAILATHVFGVPCDVEAIQAIADHRNLKVIYDAAHAFGVSFKGESLLNFGDASTLSFHATKLFHTVEGGAMICKDESLFKTMEYMRRFGHDGPYKFHGLGINGKISEVHAAMGLCILPHMESIYARRKAICDMYDSYLLSTALRRPRIPEGTSYNYAYYPLIFPDEKCLNRVIGALEAKAVNGRKYFSPSLNTLDYVDSDPMPVSEDISKRIFCLPLFHDLPDDAIEMISKIILENL